MSIPIFLALMAICCGYAFVRGGAPERIAAGLQVGAYAVYLFVHFVFEERTFQSANLGSAAIDLALLVALVWLAWRSTRFWPLWIAGWQLAAIVAHFAKVLDPGMLATGYAIQAQIWAYPMLLVTAVGTLRHRRRIEAGLSDPSWKVITA